MKYKKKEKFSVLKSVVRFIVGVVFDVVLSICFSNVCRFLLSSRFKKVYAF